MRSLSKYMCMWLFCAALFIVSCNVETTNPYPHDGTFSTYLLYRDREGAITLYNLPVQAMYINGIQRLQDGSAIIIADKLYHWEPESGYFTDITKQGMQLDYISTSVDGAYIYYCANYDIYRMNTTDFTPEVLLYSQYYQYMDPRISNDGRYLGNRSNTNRSSRYYPMYLDLQTGETYSLQSDNESHDNSARGILVDPGLGKIFYSADYKLWSMNMDGSNRALLTGIIPNAKITLDGKYLLSYQTDDCYFRNNLTNTWYRINNAYVNGAALAANLYYYRDYVQHKLFSYNLDTGENTMVLDSIIGGRPLSGVFYMSPAADGSSLVALVYIWAG